MTVKTILPSLFLLVLSTLTYAQESAKVNNPPVLTEAFFGDRGFYFQFVSNKKFQSIPKLGYYFATDLQTEWGESKVDDYMLQGHLTYTLTKGLNAEAGFFLNPVDGIRPSVGLVYSYFNKDWFVLANPRMDVAKNPNTELFGIIEYQPKLNEKLSLYTKFQGLYTQTLGLDAHARSYVKLRAGLTLKEFSFGLAGNFEFYGSDKINKNNFGVFLLMRL